MTDLVGRRVVVRRRIGPDGSQYSDLLGHLVTLGGDALVIRRADGSEVTVPRAEVHRLKAVPPPPVRVTREDVLALEEVAALGWPAPDTARLGGWLLRAGGGFTGRANSVLPAGEPGVPLPVALAHVEEWYAARGLPARFQVPLPAHTELDAALADQGYTAVDRAAHVLTAPVDAAVDAARAAAGRRGGAADPPPAPVVVRLDTEPSPAWLARYHYRGAAALPAVARQIMTAPARVVFVTCEREGQVVAIARAVVDGDWAGVTALEVREDQRRQGLAGRVMAAALEWAGQRGARRMYLQVADGNQPALALYARLGFTRHHRYHYRVRP